MNKTASLFIRAIGLLIGIAAIQGCGGSGGGADAAAPAAPKYVFGTSVFYKGDFGGLSGADTICGTHASAAGLAGTWKAWLSDSSTNAIDRINDVGPWYQVGTTTLVATTKASFALTTSSPIQLDENGTNMGTVDYWSGTATGGAKTASNCTDWSTQAGNGSMHSQPSFGSWAPGGNTTCSNAAVKLACIQQ